MGVVHATTCVCCLRASLPCGRGREFCRGENPLSQELRVEGHDAIAPYSMSTVVRSVASPCLPSPCAAGGCA